MSRRPFFGLLDVGMIPTFSFVSWQQACALGMDLVAQFATHGLVDGGRSFMLGSSSRCVALEFSSQPHGGWAHLFGCFLCNMLVHGGWCYGTQGYAHSCSWGVSG